MDVKKQKDESRYSRQSAFAGIGLGGQEKISAGRVLLIGCGALGTNIASTLVRAGVGALHIVDPDRVELSNLQRQTLFDETDARDSRFKAEAAVEKLGQANSEVNLSCYVGKFEEKTQDEFEPGKFDIIMDGTDDIVARFFINEYAVSKGLPWVFGAVAGATGMAAFFPSGGSPCLNCLFDRPALRTDVDTAQTKGVISPIVTLTTSLQCGWCLKYLAGVRFEPKLAHFDIWADQISYSLMESAGKKCEVCGKKGL